MSNPKRKYRFMLVQAFRLPDDSPYRHQPPANTKEKELMNFEQVAPLLADVEWDFHPGVLATYGNWAVENREEFAYSAAARLPVVRELCESGKYNGIVLLGGGEPGFHESREIARPYGIVVTGCAHSQFHVATLLGNRFSVIDIAESHNCYYANLIVQHRLERSCASIRNLHWPHGRPGHPGRPTYGEKHKVARGETSELLETAITEAVAAIEEDGAEVITFGCSALFWMRPFVERRLHEMGWEVPVLEGYQCAIELAKMMIDLNVSASGLTYPGDSPRKWRRKKFV